MSKPSLTKALHVYVVEGYKRSRSALEHPIFLSLLDSYADGDIALSRTALGKPVTACDDLHLSLSHSGDLLVIAFSKDGPVGVDVEKVKERRYRDRIAKKYGFASGDLEPFYREWVTREAFIKLKGGSIARDLSRIRVADGDVFLGLSRRPSACVDYFTPKPGYIAALCRARGAKEIDFFYINPSSK